MMNILYIYKAKEPEWGGVEQTFFGWSHCFNRSKYHFDYLSPYNDNLSPQANYFDLRGSRRITLNTKQEGLIGTVRFLSKLKKYIKIHDYDYIHIHSGAYFFLLGCALACRKGGNKKIIVHSHSISHYKGLKQIIVVLTRPVLRRITNRRLGCSKNACRCIYGKNDNFTVVPNSMDAKCFIFNTKDQNSIRKDLSIPDDATVYGYVSRFSDGKNHEFLLNIFEKIREADNKNKTYLLLVGDGPKKEDVLSIVKNARLEKYVLFVDHTTNVAPYYSAMDAFIFPSKHEGFGMVGIEAQASGLPLFYSDKVIPDEIRVVKKNVYPISLDKSASEWADIIRKKFVKQTAKERITCNKLLQESPYNIDKTIDALKKIYS